MITSAKGITFLENREGERKTVYRDSRGIWTIGIGFIRDLFGKQVTANTAPMTQQQIDQEFANNLKVFELCVNSHITKPITQNQFDACISLAYNIGVQGFASTQLVKNINAGIPVIQQNFTNWANPKILLSRRQKEYILFCQGIYS